jgi:SAM-dependent methyltransferase
MSNDFLFVDENLHAYLGEEAEERLRTMNDATYLEGAKGIVKVSQERWRLAQQYERKTWMESSAHADDDRNEDHAESFDYYESIAGKNFARAIELGCGPFTNIRLLARRAEIHSCVLLDPLADSYQLHRNCKYKHGLVTVSNSRLHDWLGKSLAGRAARRILRFARPQSLEVGVRIESLLPFPIEQIPACGVFDLIVMINVLEHCYDAELIFHNLLRLSRPGTVFVFHDRLYDAQQVRDEAGVKFDAGHPLRISGSRTKAFLADHFVPLFQREKTIDDHAYGMDFTEDSLYFIGSRR